MRLGGRLYDRDQVTAIVSLLLVALVLLRDPAPDTAPAGASATPAEAGSVSAAPTGSGCTEDDPTTSGCLTPATAHGLAEIARAFGGYAGGPVIRSTSCWDEHAWNPASDHPRGKGCDVFPGRGGEFAAGADLDHGWQVARWLLAHQEPLAVRYVIWQGCIWSDQRGNWADPDGAPYTGGGVYDPADATGGHYDHLHISFER